MPSFSSKAVLFKSTVQWKVIPSIAIEIVNVSVEHSVSIFNVHAFSSRMKLETTMFSEDYIMFIPSNSK
jgi:hypothetical protein